VQEADVQDWATSTSTFNNCKSTTLMTNVVIQRPDSCLGDRDRHLTQDAGDGNEIKNGTDHQHFSGIWDITGANLV
jgi:hypothetical protein